MSVFVQKLHAFFHIITQKKMIWNYKNDNNNVYHILINFSLHGLDKLAIQHIYMLCFEYT